MFDNLITPEFKKLFNSSIDTILAKNALAIPCKLVYDSSKNPTLCNNCLFDPITQLSANTYNGSGPISFGEGHICPVCLGAGYTSTNNTMENVDLGVIFDSKYWLQIPTDTVKVSDGMVQTICSSSLLSKIRNARYLIIDNALQNLGSYSYERAGDPNLCGFGNTDYIFTMWTRK